jgi:hypothetical protein
VIEQRLLKLKKLGAGDEQCADCLRLQAPNMNALSDCKKCIEQTPAFTAQVLAMAQQFNRETP